MKNILLFFLICLCVPVWADSENDLFWNKPTYEKKVTQIGQRLLNANHIDEKIAFLINHSKNAVNAASSNAMDIVVVDEGLLSYIENDDQLAAILSHEISHIILKHKNVALPEGEDKTFSSPNHPSYSRYPYYSPNPYYVPGSVVIASSIRNTVRYVSYLRNEKISQRQEIEADSKGIVLMSNAGYNPEAFKQIALKLFSDGNKTIWRGHPLGSERLALIDKKILEVEATTRQTQSASQILPAPSMPALDPITKTPLLTSPPNHGLQE